MSSWKAGIEKWKKYKSRTCYKKLNYPCWFCRKDIVRMEKYYDGGGGSTRKAHVKCVELMESIFCNEFP